MRKGNLYWSLVILLIAGIGIYFYSLRNESHELSYSDDDHDFGAKN
jgi:hypothetical protein